MKRATEMTKLTAPTIIQWYQFYRDVCSNWLLRNHIQIGGEGVTVELDESVVARRKYNHGRLIKEKWVFDRYAPTSGGVFLELVPDRSASTLLPLVRKYVVPGSTIITDKWKSYCGISKMEVEPRYLHQEVDHSKNFVDPKTGACTNRIEAMWNSCKKKNSKRCAEYSNQCSPVTSTNFSGDNNTERRVDLRPCKTSSNTSRNGIQLRNLQTKTSINL